MVLFLLRSINVYKAVVLTTLLYGAICASSSVAISVLNIHWMIGVISSTTLRSLKWLRLPASRPCSSKHSFAGQEMSPGWKTIAYQRTYCNIYGELSTSHRDKWTSKKIYKVTLKRSLATCNIDYRQWTTQATNCMNWRCTVYQATTSFETTRIDRRSGLVDVLNRHTGFESCAAVLKPWTGFITLHCSN